MIVLHPNSVCDVCLEGYGATNAPYAIACGHIFCLKCLRSLGKLSCPLCRCGFHAHDVRKLHVDDTSRSISPSSSTSSGLNSRPSSPPATETSIEARQLQSRITHIVLDGAESLSEVWKLIDEVRVWLGDQSEDKHLDLRSAYLLLFKYSNVQNKFKDSKEIITNLQHSINELKDKAQVEKETYEARYQELSQKRVSEMETAMAVERSLRDHFDRMNDEWKSKYDSLTEQYIRLQDETKKLKQKPLSGLSRPSESRPAHANERSPDLMAVVEDEDPDDTLTENEPFVLSPIPPSATLPISSRPNRQVFRALTAEESDVEDLKSRKTSPYFMRSVDPITIRQPVHRMNSNSSLLSRHDADSAVSRSIPRSSAADVHMASCSSSPVNAQTFSRDRDGPMYSASAISPQETSRSAKFGERSRSSSSSEPQYDQAEQERRRAQLHNILETPQMSLDAKLRSPEPRSRSIPKPESSEAPVTRTTSPTSPASATHPSQGIHTSTLLRPPLSRASTAAMQAERERARTLSNKESASFLAPAPQPSAPREKEAYPYPQGPSPPPPQPSQAQYYPRRPSVGSSTRGKPQTFANQPSGLTRSMWTLQDPSRTS